MDAVIIVYMLINEIPSCNINLFRMAGLPVTMSPSLQVPTIPDFISGYKYTHPSPSAYKRHNISRWSTIHIIYLDGPSDPKIRQT